MTAAAQFTRIVSLVADLSRRAANGEDDVALGDLAEGHGVSVRDITADLRALTLIGDDANADWLLSLCVLQQRDRVSVSSAGPFRRPVQLSPEERLAIQVALALDKDGVALAARFASLWAGRGAGKPSPGHEPDEQLDLLRKATRELREARISYAGVGERSASDWLLEPHQVAESHGRTYMVAWACDMNAWRHFRLDRVLSVELTGRTFARRPDFAPLERPEDVFRPGEEMDRVTVRFSPTVAPSVIERYPEHERQPDGAVVVRFTTASPEWMARKVLEYGADAEVVEPQRYRVAVRAAVA
jgi:proteasome accessory factor C